MYTTARRPKWSFRGVGILLYVNVFAYTYCCDCAYIIIRTYTFMIVHSTSTAYMCTQTIRVLAVPKTHCHEHAFLRTYQAASQMIKRDTRERQKALAWKWSISPKCKGQVYHNCLKTLAKGCVRQSLPKQRLYEHAPFARAPHIIYTKLARAPKARARKFEHYTCNFRKNH